MRCSEDSGPKKGFGLLRDPSFGMTRSERSQRDSGVKHGMERPSLCFRHTNASTEKCRFEEPEPKGPVLRRAGQRALVRQSFEHRRRCIGADPRLSQRGQVHRDSCGDLRGILGAENRSVASDSTRPEREPEAESALLRDRLGVKVAISYGSAISTALAKGEVRVERLGVVVHELLDAERSTFFFVSRRDEEHLAGRWILME